MGCSSDASSFLFLAITTMVAVVVSEPPLRWTDSASRRLLFQADTMQEQQTKEVDVDHFALMWDEERDRFHKDLIRARFFTEKDPIGGRLWSVDCSVPLFLFQRNETDDSWKEYQYDDSLHKLIPTGIRMNDEQVIDALARRLSSTGSVIKYRRTETWMVPNVIQPSDMWAFAQCRRLLQDDTPLRIEEVDMYRSLIPRLIETLSKTDFDSKTIRNEVSDWVIELKGFLKGMERTSQMEPFYLHFMVPHHYEMLKRRYPGVMIDEEAPSSDDIPCVAPSKQ